MASIELSRYEAEEGDLPDVCMCCGEEATERKRRRFISHPLWVFLLLPFIPIYLIVSILLTEDIRCYTLFCPRHKNYFLIRSLFVWCSLIVVLALIVGGFFLVLWLSGQDDHSAENYLFGSFCIGTVALFMGWLISIPISQVTAIHPAKATRSRLTLKRVSPAFVEAVLQHRENHALEAQPADYQEHFQPRRPGSRRRKEDDEGIEPA
jgi:hypothetical protein